MSKRNGLQQSLVDAKQSGRLDDFLTELNKLVKLTPADYLVWAVKAQAHDIKGQTAQAIKSYESMLRLAERPDKRTLNQLFFFAKAHGKYELVEAAVSRFGSHSFKPDQLAEIETARAVRPASPPVTRIVVLKKRDEVEANKGVRLNKLMATANRQVQSGDLQRAVSTLEIALKLSYKPSKPLYLLAVVHQRLSHIDDALAVLAKGIESANDDQQILSKFLILQAQILQSAKRWEAAAEAYNSLIRVQSKAAARRFSKLQLVSILKRLKRVDEAEKIIAELAREFPQDPVALRMHAELGQIAIRAEPMETVDQEEQDATRELDVDLQDKGGVGLETISPMLKHDVEFAKFHDGKILSQGSQPYVSDAFRILESAQATAATKLDERYPVYLEAAKAFNKLPIGSYDLKHFARALAGYAVLKGRSIVAEFRRQLIADSSELQSLRRMRDTATSYFLEGLALQIQLDYVDPKYVLASVEYHLRCQIAYALAIRGKSEASEVFATPLPVLFHAYLNHSNPELAKLTYECVVCWGSVGKQVWRVTWRSKIGPVLLQALTVERSRSYKILSEISAYRFDDQQELSEVLKRSFLAHRETFSQVVEFFASLRQMELSVQTLRELYTAWQKLPPDHPALLETDHEIRENIAAMLSVLSPFTDRTQQERTGILFTTRNSIENLLRFIEENPTYWGRVEFEELLRRWQTSIRDIEQRRVRDIHPVIDADSASFQLNGNFLSGSISLVNRGNGTAEGVKLGVEIRTHDGELLAELKDGDDVVRETIKAKQDSREGEILGRLNLPLEVDITNFEGPIVDTPYKLHLKITPLFRGAEIDPVEKDFTLEIRSKNSPSFSSNEIPWDPLKFPSERLFKGREKFIQQLIDHLRSSRRNQTYVLYGLSRTGKTSILKYLEQELDLKPVTINGQPHQFISFLWSLDQASGQSKASDLWEYFLLSENTDSDTNTSVTMGLVPKLKRYAMLGSLDVEDIPTLRNIGSVRFKDWTDLINQMSERHLYPVFLIDEFSYYSNLVDNKRIDGSFLAAIREYALSGRASFVFAGTYDLTKIIQDPRYGVRGQLVNTIDKRVSRIERIPAEALIQVMAPKLWFTPEAVSHILNLSWQLPSYIQLICQACGQYAAREGRSILGYPEVERVTKVLVGEEADTDWAPIQRIPLGRFHGSMIVPSDPPHFGALLTTICYLTKDQIQPRLVTYAEIQKVWHDHGIKSFHSVAEAIRELLDREVLIAGKDEDEFAYKISVDLFRRWWANERDNLTLELHSLKGD